MIKLVAVVTMCAGSLVAQRAGWTGLLVDAGCRERAVENLRTPALQEAAPAPPQSQPPRGIDVAPGVMKAERGEVMLPHTLDHASRYSSSTCAITADTKAFALLLADGNLLNLNEGGNTLALEAFQSSGAGESILNGKTGGLKPQAVVVGRRQGDTLRADAVRLTSR